MQKAKRQPPRKQVILKAALIFIVSFFLSLVLWIQIKNSYSFAVITIASNLITFIKDVAVAEITKQGNDVVQATFSPLRHKADILMDIPIKTSVYTFNVPLTFGIIAALFLFIRRRKRAYLETLLLLFSVHLLTVFCYEAAQLTTAFVEREYDPNSTIRVSFFMFLWQFTEHMVIRFEPFLIGFYMFIRFRIR